MTTTQPPLQPGDRVFIEAEAVQRVEGITVLILTETDARPPHERWITAVDPQQVRWHPMPAEDTPTTPLDMADPDPSTADVHAVVQDLRGAAMTTRTTAVSIRAAVQLLVVLARQRDEALADNVELRKVVDAAWTWRAGRLVETRGERNAADDTFAAAVDAYRARQTGPAEAPASPVRLHELEAERDEARLSKAAMAVGHLEDLRAEHVRARAELDALRAELVSLADSFEDRGHASGHIAWHGAADELRFLLDAPPTTTPASPRTDERPEDGPSERDDLRERADHYQRERDEYRAAQQRALRDREAVEAEMDRRVAEAAGKLDALRAGVAEIADSLADPPAVVYGTAQDAYRYVAHRLRALLAPPTATPDGGIHADPAV